MQNAITRVDYIIYMFGPRVLQLVWVVFFLVWRTHCALLFTVFTFGLVQFRRLSSNEYITLC